MVFAQRLLKFLSVVARDWLLPDLIVKPFNLCHAFYTTFLCEDQEERPELLIEARQLNARDIDALIDALFKVCGLPPGDELSASRRNVLQQFLRALQEASCHPDAGDQDQAVRDSLNKTILARSGKILAPDNVTPDQVAVGRPLLRSSRTNSELLAGQLPQQVPSIPGHRLVSVLGGGTFGTVYLAIEERTGTPRAVKVIHAGTDQQFEREVRMLGRLRGPRVVRIHQHGRIGDLYWIAMDFAGHWTLADIITGRPSPRESISLARQVLRGLAVLHRADVIHRDLKPGNIVVDQSLQLRVVDFGLARELPTAGKASTQPQTVGLLGTPRYMSPEQITGDGVTKASDVWAFGCILYELFTGTPLFNAENEMALGAQILAVSPNLAHPDVPGEYLPFLKTCLARNPEDRWAGADEALQHFEPAPASNTAFSTLRAVLLGVGLFSIILVGALFWFRSRVQEPGHPTNKLLAQSAIQQMPVPPGKSTTSDPKPAPLPKVDKQDQPTGPAAPSPPALIPSVPEAAPQPSPSTTPPPTTPPAGNPQLERPQPGIHDLPPEPKKPAFLRQEVQADRAIRVMAISPDGKSMATGGNDRQVKVWDVKSGELLVALEGHVSFISGLAWAPDGKSIASMGGMGDRTMRLWDVPNKRERAIFPEALGRAESAAFSFSPDGKTLYGASADPQGDGRIVGWDWRNRREIARWPAHMSGITGLTFTPDGKAFCSASGDNQVKIWDGVRGGLKATLWPKAGCATCLATSPDGRLLATGYTGKTFPGDNGSAVLWDVRTGKEICVLQAALRGQEGGVTAVAFSTNGQILATGTTDGLIRLWNVKDGSLRLDLEGGASISGLAFASDGKTLISTTLDGTLRFWEPQLDSE